MMSLCVRMSTNLEAFVIKRLWLKVGRVNSGLWKCIVHMCMSCSSSILSNGARWILAVGVGYVCTTWLTRQRQQAGALFYSD